MSEVRFDEEVLNDTQEGPPAGDSFCHILDPTGASNYCGYVGPELLNVTCAPYNGEAICPSCGRPNCPTCTVMASLNERLVDESLEA